MGGKWKRKRFLLLEIEKTRTAVANWDASFAIMLQLLEIALEELLQGQYTS